MNVSYREQQKNGNVSAYNKDIARHPAFKGNGVDVWINVDKNGQKYLSVKILNSSVVNCWKYEPKPAEHIGTEDDMIY